MNIHLDNILIDKHTFRYIQALFFWGGELGDLELVNKMAIRCCTVCD